MFLERIYFAYDSHKKNAIAKGVLIKILQNIEQSLRMLGPCNLGYECTLHMILIKNKNKEAQKSKGNPKSKVRKR